MVGHESSEIGFDWFIGASFVAVQQFQGVRHGIRRMRLGSVICKRQGGLIGKLVPGRTCARMNGSVEVAAWSGIAARRTCRVPTPIAATIRVGQDFPRLETASPPWSGILVRPISTVPSSGWLSVKRWNFCFSNQEVLYVMPSSAL